MAELEQRLSQSDAAKAEFSREIAALEQRLSQSDDAAADLSRETTELKQLLSESDEARVELSREAAELVQRLSLSDETIGALNRKAEELQHQLGESEQARQALEEAGRKAGAQARKKLAQLQETLAGKESRIAKLEEQRDRKAEEVRLLKLKVRSIYDSTSWRLAAPLRFVARRLTWLRPKRAKKPGPAALKMSAPTVAKTPVATTAKKEKSPAIVQKAAAKKPARADGKGALPQQARRLEDRLWGGFSRYALAELEALKRSRSSDPVEVAAAARALAGWYTAENDFRRGKENAALARSLTKGKAGREHALVEAHCLVRMGRGADARKVLAPLLAKYPDDPNVLLAMANSYVGSGGDGASDGIRLSWINRIYEKAGLLPLAKADPAGALTIDNLSTPEPDQVDHAAKVSIVVPMFNAAETLAFTLDGIGRQSWRNIEVLLMDDCSTDETLSLAEAFAAADPRFRVVRQERNGGSYSARNRALGLASGDFITIHDAGDWSHPQKIEIQARHLLDNEGVAANHTRWARAFDDLFFTGKFRHKDRILDWNPSSVFFRRSLLEKVGGWDGGVRISADAEFVRRIRIAVPQGNVVSAFDAAPLAFGLDTPSSLTKASATHGRTIFHGLRRDYREASDHWHAQASPEALRLDIGARTRPFPAPAAILCDREIPVRCDVVLIDDFNRGDAVR